MADMSGGCGLVSVLLVVLQCRWVGGALFCDGKSAGLHADPSNCYYFFNCPGSDGWLDDYTRRPCAPGTAFDVTLPVPVCNTGSKASCDHMMAAKMFTTTTEKPTTTTTISETSTTTSTATTSTESSTVASTKLLTYQSTSPPISATDEGIADKNDCARHRTSYFRNYPKKRMISSSSHVINLTSLRSRMICGSKCLLYPSCVGFNFRSSTVTHCEIILESNTASLTNSLEFSYYEVVLVSSNNE